MAALDGKKKKVGLFYRLPDNSTDSGQTTETPNLGFDNSPIRIFAGNTEENTIINSSFYVTENGGLLAKNMRVAWNFESPYIMVCAEEEKAYIQSDNYYPDRRGWRIDNTGYGEFENVKVRGELTTVVFKREEISAVGG